MKKMFLLSLCFMLMSAGVAQIIHVPDDYPTIQQGIEAANPGDTVLVADGTYYEQINFLGKKPLMVASTFLSDGDTNHIANTIIDGSLLNNPDSASVVNFISDEDTTSVLCGFTVRGGKGTQMELWGEPVSCGGGIYINYSGATVRNNIIQDNEVNDTLSEILLSVCGGGLFAYNGLTGWVVIKNNRVVDNRAISSHLVAEGGGLFVYNVNSRIMGNIIRNNLSQYTMTDGYCSGGGLQCMNDENIPFSGIMNNEISGNQALAADGSWGSYGGGAATWHHSNNSYIKNNTFSGNKSSIYGGGLDFFSYNQMVWNVENNYFIDNEALYGGGVDAFDSTSMIILKNNVFIKNTAYDQGGGIYINRNNGSPDEHPLISINNSFYDNQAYGAGGAIYAYEDNPLIFNSIFWQNPGMDNNEITVESGTAEIAFSDLDTNLIAGNKIIGAGMINADPMFRDTSLLTIDSQSPCFDMGATEYNCVHGMLVLSPAMDILGIPRPLGQGIDMGAYEASVTYIPDQSIRGELSFLVYPNPVNDHLFIDYELNKPGVVILKIYDITGIPVKSFTRHPDGTGSHHVEIEMRDLPAGIYLLRLQEGYETGSMKVIKY